MPSARAGPTHELDPLERDRAVRMVADRGEHQQGAAIERKARDPGADRREPVTNLVRSLPRDWADYRALECFRFPALAAGDVAWTFIFPSE